MVLLFVRSLRNPQVMKERLDSTIERHVVVVVVKMMYIGLGARELKGLKG